MLRMGYIVSGVALLAATVGCEHRAVPPTMAEVRAEEEPDQESWGVRFLITEVPIMSEESQVRMEMIADYMAQYEHEDSTYQLLHGHPDSLDRRVLAHLYDAAGDSSATLTADRVFYYEEDKRFVAEGNVIVITTTGKQLESERLVWLEDERKVRTQSFVRITTPTEQLQGYGLEADEDLKTYRITRFTTQIVIEEETQ